MDEVRKKLNRNNSYILLVLVLLSFRDGVEIRDNRKKLAPLTATLHA